MDIKSNFSDLSREEQIKRLIELSSDPEIKRLLKEQNNMGPDNNACDIPSVWFRVGRCYDISLKVTGFDVYDSGKVVATFSNGSAFEIFPSVHVDTDDYCAKMLRNYDINQIKNLPNRFRKKIIKALSVWRRRVDVFGKYQYKGARFDKIIFKGPATILTGCQNEKTVIKCSEKDVYDPEKALLIALFIREYGKSTYNDLMKMCHDAMPEEPTKEVPPGKLIK